MKKIPALFTAFILISFAAAAQAFKESDKLLNLGIGIGTPYFGSGYKSKLPVNPTITFEKGIQPNISVGGTLSYASSKYNYYFDLNYTAIFLGARGSYHFPLSNQKTDLYAGAGLGYVIVSVSSKESGYSASAASGVGYNVFGGVRYYVGAKAAVYAELGYGSLSIGNAGVSFKF